LSVIPEILDMLTERDWMLDAACIGTDENIWFPVNSGNRKLAAAEAKAICAVCPVRLTCLQYALDYELTADRAKIFGIYGGKTATERMVILRRMRGLQSRKPAEPKKPKTQSRQFPVAVRQVEPPVTPRRTPPKRKRPKDLSNRQILNLDDEEHWQEFRWRVYLR
jgi:WhiB family transcriptional regulator, redox-sensing transcriptional regulator